MTKQVSDDLSPLVQIEQKNLAHLFANYLITQGIAAHVVVEEKQGQTNKPVLAYTIFCPHNMLAQAKLEFEQFIKHPYHSKYQQAAWQHGETVKVEGHELTLLTTFKDSFLAHAGIVTLIIFAGCWLVFIASSLGWAESVFTQLKFYPQLSLDALSAEPWRLIGPAFFHFSWLHIVFNTMWWWQLGGAIERALGKSTLINLLLISAIFSNLGQFVVSGANFGGLSGVVYALMGFMWWYGYLLPEHGLSLSKPIVGFLLFWLVLGFADLLPINMANTAHLLGLMSGCLYALFVVKFSKK